MRHVQCRAYTLPYVGMRVGNQSESGSNADAVLFNGSRYCARFEEGHKTCPRLLLNL